MALSPCLPMGWACPQMRLYIATLAPTTQAYWISCRNGKSVFISFSDSLETYFQNIPVIEAIKGPG